MATIYLVSVGAYSDYSIIGAYSTEERAQLVVDEYNSAPHKWSEAGIEEFEIDAEVDRLSRGEHVFFVRMLRNGSSEVHRSRPGSSVLGEIAMHNWSGGGKVLSGDVWAKDEAHAIKIVNERRSALIASNKWEENAEVKG